MESSTFLPGGACPHAHEVEATVIANERMAHQTYRMRLKCPTIARSILPGQFFMVRPAQGSDPLLGRPFALYDTYEEGGEPAGVDFGYLIVGKLTSEMPSWQPGSKARVWGPLGNGFSAPPEGRLICVAGGIGQTPFLALSRELLTGKRYGAPKRTVAPADGVTLLYGVRRKEFLAGVGDFQMPNLNLRIATDDGSAGHHGFVTALLREELESPAGAGAVYCCGPEPMMHAVAELCAAAGVPCWLSLESPMACGFGACFSCVVRVRTEEGWDYRRSCVEGPVFRADQLCLSEL